MATRQPPALMFQFYEFMRKHEIDIVLFSSHVIRHVSTKDMSECPLCRFGSLATARIALRDAEIQGGKLSL